MSQSSFVNTTPALQNQPPRLNKVNITFGSNSMLSVAKPAHDLSHSHDRAWNEHNYSYGENTYDSVHQVLSGGKVFTSKNPANF